MYLTPHIRCEDDEAALRRWSEEFYGPKLGALIPPACQTPDSPSRSARIGSHLPSSMPNHEAREGSACTSPSHSRYAYALAVAPASAQRSVSVTVGDGHASGRRDRAGQTVCR